MYTNNTLYLWKRKTFRENVKNNKTHNLCRLVIFRSLKGLEVIKQ